MRTIYYNTNGLLYRKINGKMEFFSNASKEWITSSRTNFKGMVKLDDFFLKVIKGYLSIPENIP